MEKWVRFAFISMAFAGMTSVIAKLGLTNISGDLGLTIRTGFVFIFVSIFALLTVPRTELASLNWNSIAWLALSAVTTTGSWIFYYKAIKLGDVSKVALIDKGSFVVAVVLAWLILKEPITPRVCAGAVLIVAGLLVVAWK